MILVTVCQERVCYYYTGTESAMAESEDVNGYAHEFVHPPPDGLVCPICLLVARDPQQSTCCGKVYCETCLADLRRHSNSCPHCRDDINCFPDKRSGRDIKSLKTRCDNSTNGCQWIGELRFIEEHSVACDYALLPCPNECTGINGSDNILCVLHKDMEKHLNEDCSRREYVCPHCEESGEYQEMTTTHLEECDCVEVPCPNEGCDEHIERRSMLLHQYTVCDFEKVHCKYENIGCQKQLLRKDLEQHENDVQYHLQFTIETVNDNVTDVQDVKITIEELEKQADLQKKVIKRQENTLAHLQSVIVSQSKEISELRSKLERLKSDDIGQWISGRRSRSNAWSRRWVQASTTDSNQESVFKFTDFAQRKSCNESVYSPPIYSSLGGYKMCFRVYANSNGAGEGSSVSVFAYLMRGENDDHLTWPFTGKVVIELLNQLEDRNHRTKTVQFIKNHDSSQRVVDRHNNRADTGYGHLEYIPHSSLGYNPVKNCQYLKDDCLYFRFEIVCVSATKLWLASANVF